MQGEREREGGRGRVKQGRSALSPSLKSRDSSLSLPLILGAKGSIGGMEKGRGREGGRAHHCLHHGVPEMVQGRVKDSLDRPQPQEG